MKRAVIVVCLLAAGCGFMKRTPNTFYTLDTIPGTARAAISGTPIGIDGVELPPGLDRREVTARAADNKLDVRGHHQWASPLEDMVNHTLSFDLASRLPEGMVILPGTAKPGAMRSLYVTFEDLAPGPDNVFVLDARWTMGDLTRHERVTVPLSSADSAAVVAAMSQALAQLSDRIAAAL
ncbi:MAG TPA: PqiC family protein [Thermoanaerobaculia bacterium]|nr:PqiC family protein [Thermoanaerobaculia bacterium]